MLENFITIAVILFYSIIVFNIGAFYIIWKIANHSDRREVSRRIDELRDSLDNVKGNF